MFDPAPEVELIRWFEAPQDQSVGAARTCYSSRVIYPDEVSRDEPARARRDGIARSIYKAGHHTTIQHPHFTFVLKRVSRHFIWSFLHAHPFYNSEQVSQRYVAVRRGAYATPPLPEPLRERFHACVAAQTAAYERLRTLLAPEVARRFYETFPGRRREPARWEKAIEKRCLEVARYVLPVATHAHLYHTVSGVTLFRYRRALAHFDAPTEQRLVVDEMVRLVRELDPAFTDMLEDPVPLEETAEHQALAALYGRQDGLGSAADFVAEFDAALGERVSRLEDHGARAEAMVAAAVRTALGASAARLKDDDAIALALDPARNAQLGSPLNLTTHLKLTRALHHAHFTFRKKLSHTADSQDQRHRMTPGTRPILATHYRVGTPDYILPPLVEAVPEALAVYRDVMAETWRAIDGLLEAGTPPELALYLLPNAFPVRFFESGDLSAQLHKWRLRLCYLAQEEIYRASREEVLDVQAHFPRLAAHITAPCGARRRAGLKPFCPEGERFCGVPVWQKAVADYARSL